jgi:hypothetical protein
MEFTPVSAEKVGAELLPQRSDPNYPDIEYTLRQAKYIADDTKIESIYHRFSLSDEESQTCYDEHNHKEWIPYWGRSRRNFSGMCFSPRLGP